eukprot:828124-Rhodomonas_salina.1
MPVLSSDDLERKATRHEILALSVGDEDESQPELTFVKFGEASATRDPSVEDDELEASDTFSRTSRHWDSASATFSAPSHDRLWKRRSKCEREKNKAVRAFVPEVSTDLRQRRAMETNNFSRSVSAYYSADSTASSSCSALSRTSSTCSVATPRPIIKTECGMLRTSSSSSCSSSSSSKS